MRTDGLLIGAVAARSGVSRRALRLYESAGILLPPRRTAVGYRVYGSDAVALLAFVAQARRLGFRLDEIRDIVAIKRADGIPCPHVRELVRRKTEEVERQIAELGAVRQRLRRVATTWRSTRARVAAVCPHIEQPTTANRREKR